jgi:hypothetical protein
MHLWSGGCSVVHGGQEICLNGFISRVHLDQPASLQRLGSGFVFQVTCYYG